jgi:hypothetical protein
MNQRPTNMLLSKQGVAIAALAQALLACVPGQRIEPIQEHAIRLNTSVGTIQAALDSIQEFGAATIEARGRLGSFAVRLDYAQLWRLGQQRAIVGALPLPYARRIEGLATGLREQIGQHVDLNLRFLRGSARRMQALSTKECDWALVSRFAAETAAAHGFQIERVALLGAETYMAGQVLLTRGSAALAPGDDGLRDGMRVGVDPQSGDQQFLVRSVTRGRRVTFIEIEYSQGLHLLQSGAIDATIWSAEAIPATLGSLQAVPIDQQREPAMMALSEAALIVAHGDRATAHLLGTIYDRDTLVQVQQDVISGQRRPGY